MESKGERTATMADGTFLMGYSYRKTSMFISSVLTGYLYIEQRLAREATEFSGCINTLARTCLIQLDAIFRTRR